MARKLSGGLVGQPSVGAINVAPTAVVTAAENQDITLSPVGTGSLVVTNNVQLNAQNDLRFADADSSNYVAFQAPSTVASNVTWTLPNADGSASQALVTNGSGTLSFAAAGPALTDNNSDAGTNYLVFTTSTSGNLTAARVATTTRALSYQPSTGTLTATAYVESSSITLKENLVPITDALSKILHLQSYIYDRKDGSAKNEVGLIAEYVNPIIPELVLKDENGDPTGIRYTKLTAYLVESIKSLKQEIDNLRQKVETV
jgi:hypothetical protein